MGRVFPSEEEAWVMLFVKLCQVPPAPSFLLIFFIAILPPQPLATTTLLPASKELPFLGISSKRTFYVWIISLSIMFSRFGLTVPELPSF